MADLISSAYAKRRINQASFTAGEDTLIAELVAAVSKQVRTYCRREFDAQSFDELYSGNGRPRLLLREFPVLSVARVATGWQGVLAVKNTSSANQRATVAVTSTGITLVRVASGVVTTDTTVTFAGNVTLGSVATAIAALGNGWDARVLDVARDTNWPSADLRAVQGALSVADSREVQLGIHAEELSDYAVDAARGWLLRSPGPGWPGDWNTGPEECCGYWTPGLDNYRVIYTAGFATVPEAVQEAAAEWAAALYWQSKRDPGWVQQTIPNVFSFEPILNAQTLLPSVRGLLAPYRKHELPRP